MRVLTRESSVPRVTPFPRVMDGLARHIRYLTFGAAEDELKRLGWNPQTTVGLTSNSRYIYVEGCLVWSDTEVLRQ